MPQKPVDEAEENKEAVFDIRDAVMPARKVNAQQTELEDEYSQIRKIEFWI